MDEEKQFSLYKKLYKKLFCSINHHQLLSAFFLLLSFFCSLKLMLDKKAKGLGKTYSFST